MRAKPALIHVKVRKNAPLFKNQRARFYFYEKLRVYSNEGLYGDASLTRLSY
jgi:hypothetical protein